MDTQSYNSLFNILIIEDDRDLAFLIRKNLQRQNYEVDIANNGQEAFQKIITFKPDLLLLDYKLSDISGEDIVKKLKSEGTEIPFVIMTGFGDERIAVDMMKLGASDYLVKDQNFIEIFISVVERVKKGIETNNQLHKTKKDLKKSEERFKALIENDVSLVGILNKDGDFIYHSPAFERILGSENNKCNFYDLLSEINYKAIKKKFEDIKSGKTKLCTINFRTYDFNRKIVYLQGTLHNQTDDPNINGIVVNLRDVTKRKIAEDKIRKLERAVSQSSVGILITNKQGIIEYINPYYTQLTGYEPEELIGKMPNIFQSGRTSKAVYKNLWKRILSGKEWRGHFLNKRKNGELFWENITINPIFDNEGEITHFLGIKEDITEKKKIQDKLKRANEFYLTIMEDSPVMIWKTNIEGVKDFFNKSWLKFKGSTLLEEVQNNWKNSIHEDDIDEYLSTFEKNFNDRKSYTTTYRILNRNEEYRWITEFGKPLHDLDNSFVGFIGTCIDNTDIKEAEEKMRQAKDEAEKSEKLKTEFLAQVSHEIRTPLNSILSFTSLLKMELEGNDNKSINDSFNAIDRGGKRLIRTIDLILNMSEIQTGSYKSEIKSLSIHEIIDDVIVELSQKALQKNLKLKFNNELGEKRLSVDYNSVTKIFSNLIDNAIKYTDDGFVSIRIYQDGNSRTAIDVADTGIGISESFIPFLFEPFSQEETGYTRKFEGNGLGLALVKKYCELNNADITVESIKGKGSTFTVLFDK